MRASDGASRMPETCRWSSTATLTACGLTGVMLAGPPTPRLRRDIFALEARRAEAAKVGGAEGDRTPDLSSAIAALSQLSYGPGPRAFRDRASALSSEGPPGQFPAPERER